MSTRTDGDLTLDVKRIGKRWSAVLRFKGVVHDRMACENKVDIGWMCREMLRWHIKLGGSSRWASAARRRQQAGPIGRVWYRIALEPWAG